MFNRKCNTQMKLWRIKIVMIFCFSISAIALTNSTLYLQKVIKEHFFKDLSKDSYEDTGEIEDIDDPGRPIGKVKHENFWKAKKSNKKINITEDKNPLGSLISFLSNSWITISFYIIFTGIIAYSLYNSVQKRMHKKKRQQNEPRATQHTVREEKKETSLKNPIYQLPTDPVRIKLIEWERSLAYYEKRRTYESIQRWLSRICRTKDIIPVYESIRCGNNPSTEEDLQKIMQWIQRNK